MRTTADTKPPRIAVMIALFWSVTYALFTLRAALLPAPPFDPLSGKRLVAITLGALICGAAIRTLRRTTGQSGARRAGLALFVSAAGAALLLVVRSGFDDIAGVDDDTLADEARWLLMWLGYYVAWLLLDVAMAARPVASAPLPLSDPVEDAALWIHRNQQLVRVPIETISWIAAEGNYARVHANDGSGLLRTSLAQLAARLAPAGFLRLHRSALCHRDRIAAVRRRRTGAMIVVLRDGTEVPVGRAVGQRLLDEARQRPVH